MPYLRRRLGYTALALLLLGAFAAHAARAQQRTRVTVYTAWDDEFFYLAAVVQKPNVAGKAAAPFADPRNDDAIALYLQPVENGADTKRSESSVEMMVSAAGGAQLYRGADGRPLQGFDDFKKDTTGAPVPFRYRSLVRGQINEPGGLNTGYTVEMALPWLELGGPPKPGQRMKFHVAALSAAPGSPPVMSSAPGVRSREDLQNPSLWGELIFVDAAVQRVESAPNARVSGRILSRKPLMDGILSEGEWSSVTAFELESGSGGAAASGGPNALGPARTARPVELKKAPPLLAAAESGAPAKPAPRNRQPLPRLVFALYDFRFQNDPRKSAPLVPARAPDGSSILATHPMEGDGPWMTYDRVEWHRAHLEQMRAAALDCVLPVYRAGRNGADSRRGLLAYRAALNEIQNAGGEFPYTALYLDTASLIEGDEKLDLADEAAQARVYGAIQEFYLHIPSRFRLAIPLSSDNGGGVANVAVFSSAAPFSQPGQSLVEYCRARFRADFGADLILLGDASFQSKLQLDGYLQTTQGRGFQYSGSGWIRTAALGSGYDDTLRPDSSSLRPREEGETFRSEWKEAMQKPADWVFLDSWTGYSTATELAPTLEHGVQFVDLTRAYGRLFAGSGRSPSAVLSHGIPASLAAGRSYRLWVNARNGGAAWSPEQHMLAYRWQKNGGSADSAPRTIPLVGPVAPGHSSLIPFPVVAPSAPGEYTLGVDVVQVGRGGELRPVEGGALLSRRVRVFGPEDEQDPEMLASVQQCDLPAAVEAGGPYAFSVTLRNDGGRTWKKDESRVTARLWRITPAHRGASNRARIEPVDLADATVLLPEDTLPGQSVSLQIPVTFRDSSGSPLPVWEQTAEWSYALRFEVASGPRATLTEPEALGVVPMDIGAVIDSSATPRALPGERLLSVPMTLRNAGPQTWKKDAFRIGCHWYTLDGLEVIWEDATTGLPADVEPGQETKDLLVFVTAPPYNGRYWLVWDVKAGDVWGSTQPSVRSGETRVHLVDVVGGRTELADLSRHFNLDGVSSDGDRADGDFDGSGRTLPAELTPPFTTGDIAPSGLWLPAQGSPLESARRISFRWGPSGAKEKNFVQCLGQTIPLVSAARAQAYRAVHLLAASVRGEASAGFALTFADGTQQFTVLPISAWDSSSATETVGFQARRVHTRTGEDPGHRARLFHYTIRISESKRLTAITLPRAPDVRIAAITLEK